MTPTIEEMARGLTEAEKRAVIGMSDEWQAGPSMQNHIVDEVTALRECGLVERRFGDMEPSSHWSSGDGLHFRTRACWHFRLTPLGLTLRAYLEETHG